MKLSGFTDEAAPDLESQIRAVKELGWNRLSARSIDGTNLHELSDSAFETAAEQLETAQVQVVELGSLIGNWAKSIHSDFQITLNEVQRAIPRMQRLGIPIVRVMSYAQEPWGHDQCDAERFQRLREVVARFSDAGILVAHENCMNYGGFSASHTLRLLDEVPDLRLIFDTGNPVFQRDRSRPDDLQWQDSLDFFHQVAHAVIHIHIKDCEHPSADGIEPIYRYPGEGKAQIPAILKCLKNADYQGFIAIEPHLGTVFHAQNGQAPDWDECYRTFIEYGKRCEALIAATLSIH